jgi:hypothetical protein
MGAGPTPRRWQSSCRAARGGGGGGGGARGQAAGLGAVPAQGWRHRLNKQRSRKGAPCMNRRRPYIQQHRRTYTPERTPAHMRQDSNTCSQQLNGLGPLAGPSMPAPTQMHSAPRRPNAHTPHVEVPEAGHHERGSAHSQAGGHCANAAVMHQRLAPGGLSLKRCEEPLQVGCTRYMHWSGGPRNHPHAALKAKKGPTNGHPAPGSRQSEASTRGCVRAGEHLPRETAAMLPSVPREDEVVRCFVDAAHATPCRPLCCGVLVDARSPAAAAAAAAVPPGTRPARSQDDPHARSVGCSLHHSR